MKQLKSSLLKARNIANVLFFILGMSIFSLNVFASGETYIGTTEDGTEIYVAAEVKNLSLNTWVSQDMQNYKETKYRFTLPKDGYVTLETDKKTVCTWLYDKYCTAIDERSDYCQEVSDYKRTIYLKAGTYFVSLDRNTLYDYVKFRITFEPDAFLLINGKTMTITPDRCEDVTYLKVTASVTGTATLTYYNDYLEDKGTVTFCDHNKKVIKSAQKFRYIGQTNEKYSIPIKEATFSIEKGKTYYFKVTNVEDRARIHYKESAKKGTSVSEEIKLNKTSLTLNVGKKYTLKLSGGTVTSKVKWTTSRKSVVSVSKKGVIKAKKKGTAVITAKLGGKKYTCKVSVKQQVTKVKLNKQKTTLRKLNGTIRLKATVTPKTANNKSVIWTSSNPAVATVNSKGLVTAKKSGTCKITVRSCDGSNKKATCVIKVVIKK